MPSRFIRQAFMASGLDPSVSDAALRAVEDPDLVMDESLREAAEVSSLPEMSTEAPIDMTTVASVIGDIMTSLMPGPVGGGSDMDINGIHEEVTPKQEGTKFVVGWLCLAISLSMCYYVVMKFISPEYIKRRELNDRTAGRGRFFKVKRGRLVLEDYIPEPDEIRPQDLRPLDPKVKEWLDRMNAKTYEWGEPNPVPFRSDENSVDDSLPEIKRYRANVWLERKMRVRPEPDSGARERGEAYAPERWDQLPEYQ